jgi:colanic acid biosynthesis glycosyl transferase WcaI
MTNGYRQAQVADLPEIVRIHHAAFPDFFMTALGPRFLANFYRRILSYPDHVFWLKQGNAGLEGFAAGFLHPGEFYLRMKAERLSIALIVATRVLSRPSLLPRVLASYGEVWRSIREDDKDLCELSSIAVHPDCSGKGIGQGLAAVFIEGARSRAKIIVLTTDAAGNEGVNRFYLKLGFVLADSYERSKGRWMNRYRFQLDKPPTGA